MPIIVNFNGFAIKEKKMTTIMFNDSENGLLKSKSELTSVNSTMDTAAVASSAIAASNNHESYCSDNDNHGPQIQQQQQPIQNYNDCKKTPTMGVKLSAAASNVANVADNNKSQLIYDKCSTNCGVSPSASQLTGLLMDDNFLFNDSYNNNNNNNSNDNNLQRPANIDSKMTCVSGLEARNVSTIKQNDNVDESTVYYSVVKKIPASKLEPIISCAPLIPFSTTLSSTALTKSSIASTLESHKQSYLPSFGNTVTSTDRKANMSIVSQVAPMENQRKRIDINENAATDMNSGILRSLLDGSHGKYGKTYDVFRIFISIITS